MGVTTFPGSDPQAETQLKISRKKIQNRIIYQQRSKLFHWCRNWRGKSSASQTRDCPPLTYHKAIIHCLFSVATQVHNHTVRFCLCAAALQANGSANHAACCVCVYVRFHCCFNIPSNLLVWLWLNCKVSVKNGLAIHCLLFLFVIARCFYF